MSMPLEQMASTSEMWCGRSWEGLVDRRCATFAQAQTLRSDGRGLPSSCHGVLGLLRYNWRRALQRRGGMDLSLTSADTRASEARPRGTHQDFLPDHVAFPGIEGGMHRRARGPWARGVARKPPAAGRRRGAPLGARAQAPSRYRSLKASHTRSSYIHTNRSASEGASNDVHTYDRSDENIAGVTSRRSGRAHPDAGCAAQRGRQRGGTALLVQLTRERNDVAHLGRAEHPTTVVATTSVRRITRFMISDKPLDALTFSRLCKGGSPRQPTPLSRRQLER